MLLALDAGNTNITIGAYEDKSLIGRWRLRTIREQTADEWGILMRNLFSLSSLDLSRVSGVVISSVVPAVDQPLMAMAEKYFQRQPMFINNTIDLGIKVRYDNPREVGADRLVNSVAAFYKYGGPCVSVDLGTTINFDIVSANAEFLGGIICPGIGMSIQGLFARTARQHHLRTLLRLHRHDRRHHRKRHQGTRSANQSHRDRRPGIAHRQRVEARQNSR
jgi:type III pantothenate kinase